MTPPHALARLLAAPELIVVELAESMAHGLALALLLEHPILADFIWVEASNIQRRAYAVLRDTRRLQRALHRYRLAVDGAAQKPHHDDFPF